MFYKSTFLQIHVLQITNPPFTNPCLQIESMFYKSNPVHILQIHILQIHILQIPLSMFTNPIHVLQILSSPILQYAQTPFYNSPLNHFSSHFGHIVKYGLEIKLLRQE